MLPMRVQVSFHDSTCYIEDKHAGLVVWSWQAGMPIRGTPSCLSFPKSTETDLGGGDGTHATGHLGQVNAITVAWRVVSGKRYRGRSLQDAGKISHTPHVSSLDTVVDKYPAYNHRGLICLRSY